MENNNRFIIKKPVPTNKNQLTQSLRQASVNNIVQQPQRISSQQQNQKQQIPLSKANVLVQIPQIQQQQNRVSRQDIILTSPIEKLKDIDQVDTRAEDAYKEIRQLKSLLQQKDQQLYTKDFQLQSKERELESSKGQIIAKELQNKKLEADIKKLQKELQLVNEQLLKKKEELTVEPTTQAPQQPSFDQSIARTMMLAMELQVSERRAQAMQYYNFMQEAFQPQTNQDPNFVDTDNMTYEQLLELQEKIGHVSRGMTKEQIKAIKKQPITIINKAKLPEICSICYSEFKMGEKYRALKCSHIYHGKCIKQWLNNEKKCPICKEEVS